MTQQRRRPMPADMLLVEERRRRMQGGPPHVAVVPDEDQLVADEDQLLEIDSADEPSSVGSAVGEVVLRRPISQVSLVQVSWSGPIDHDALVSAIQCFPADASDARAHHDIFAQPPFLGTHSGAGLEVALRATDLAVLRTLMKSGARAHVSQVVLAAHLPDRLTGVELVTRQVVSPVLGAYRRSSLAYGWHLYLSRSETPQLHRERDEAAVAVLSTLRALLGER